MFIYKTSNLATMNDKILLATYWNVLLHCRNIYNSESSAAKTHLLRSLLLPYQAKDWQAGPANPSFGITPT